MSRFYLAPRRNWNIDHSVKYSRRERLLCATDFDEIVAKTCVSAELFHIACEKGRKGDKVGLHRWSVTLRTSSKAIDLWHNSRGGYRAQYYLSLDTGEAANAYALEHLTKLAESLVQADRYRRRYWARASVSICHQYARVWIHQGLWCHHAKITDRLLHVQQWQLDPDDDRDTRKRKALGMLIPENETKLKIIGQWLDETNSPRATPPKADRADHIHECGFT
ncbi:hypothetical protein LRP30_33915 [Bradyrhizobium sp. C-145]|uniref:hypothetical protein n=1 Tax=Bradyrhizobium sp. C-145 TaxID=574727 RepID=UPI00201B479C|nr:hypothetical protein [Bradyrhizobium sp. C-145]UQR61759.1 hypothetical protein LRP30_33915 [Bradyrhizobium sp. C-145]